jgi:hypothetical protein
VIEGKPLSYADAVTNNFVKPANAPEAEFWETKETAI